MKRVYIRSNGCAVLMHETERIARFFNLNGWARTDYVCDADIVVMTCCGVTHNEEEQAIGIIDDIESRRNCNSLFVVSGCLPAFASTEISKVAPDAILITYQELDRFDQIISAVVPMSSVYYNVNPVLSGYGNDDLSLGEDEIVAKEIDQQYSSDLCQKMAVSCTFRRYKWQNDDIYQIKVSYGCPGKCSYCATKLAIGKFRSVEKKLVLRQFREGVDAGYKHFLLIGDEIGCYGMDFGEDLVMLLDDFYKISPDVSISIRYIHPDIFVKYYERLRPYLKCGYLDYFCSAIQSASPKILRAMNRNPDLEPFVRCMEDINANHYPVDKHTQIIVGFPNETAEDMLMTLKCLERCDFNHININIYSPRKGTKAYLLSDNVPASVKSERGAFFKTWMMRQKQAKMYEIIKRVIIDSL